MIANFPEGPGPHPALLLAPEQGYHMRLCDLTEAAEALVCNGIAVSRFDWSYVTAKPRDDADAR